jgi:aryl-alcohol dehydrogenase-like predicted oxidoreductase
MIGSPQAMESRPLGAGRLAVSKLSFGAMTFGSGFAPITKVDEALAHRLVHRALDAGVNLIDTADTYANGASEEILGRAVRGRRGEVLLATKVGFADLGPGALAYDKVVAACEASLRRLRVDCIDLYQLHRPDRTTPIDETLRALDDLMRRGLVREIGASNFRAWEVAGAVARQRALGRASFSSVQIYYSLVCRDAEHEILPQCGSDGLGVLVYSPLAGGFLSGRYDTAGAEGRRAKWEFPPVDPRAGRAAIAALDAVASARGASRAQIALAWLLAKPGVTSVIVGASKVEQLEENLAAADLVLEPDEVARLDAATSPAPLYPAFVDRRFRYPEPPGPDRLV